MRLIVVWLVVGCSFEHGVPASVGGSGNPDASTTVDAAVMVDAAVVMPPMDAPPCGDDDDDGVCNNVDDWPCGAKPTAPTATMTMTGNSGATSMTITQVNLDGSGRLAVATAQEQIQLAFHYDIEDTACPQACIDQLEIGWVPGGRVGCPFDDAVPKQTGADGTINIMVQAPSAGQVYDLRANIGQNYSCNYNGANSWWGTTPSSSRTIAKLCVH